MMVPATSSGLHFHCEVQLERIVESDLSVRTNLPIVGDDDGSVVAMQNANRYRFEFDERIVFMSVFVVMVLVLMFVLMMFFVMMLFVMMLGENECIWTVNNDGIHWEDQLVLPAFNWQTQVHSLARSKTPLVELASVAIHRLADFVRQFDEEPNRLRFFVDMVVYAKQLEGEIVVAV